VFEPADWIGVDRGIVNLATTSDGTNHQGRRLSRYRRWQARKRTELQKKRTRSATRRLTRRAQKEKRHATQVNHRISKEIVSVAQRTGRGIAVEELDGIRERVRLRRDQRGILSSWPFHQLGQQLVYKARKAGVPFFEVDAAYTSQRCPRCGHTGAGSLAPPTSSPGSTCATAHARRGCSSPHPHPPPDIRRGKSGCDP
jgi:IS605 OrfB family transposase